MALFFHMCEHYLPIVIALTLKKHPWVLTGFSFYLPLKFYLKMKVVASLQTQKKVCICNNLK